MYLSRGGPAVFYGERDSGSVGDLSDDDDSADGSDDDFEQGDGEMKEQDDVEDDAEEEDDDGAENVSQEEDISEPPPNEQPPVSGPTPARKSTKKANGRGAVGEKVKRVVSRAQMDRRNETKQKKNRKASKDGHGNAAGEKRNEFFINKEALKGITGQANAAMPHFRSLFQRFETYLLKDKKVEKTWKEFSPRFPKVLFFSKKRSESAKRQKPVLKEGGQVALFISRNNAKEFVLVAMFGSAYLAERMMGSTTDVIANALNHSEDGISGKYEDDFCHWRRATVK
jgi:hypothetical protein